MVLCKCCGDRAGVYLAEKIEKERIHLEKLTSDVSLNDLDEVDRERLAVLRFIHDLRDTEQKKCDV